MKNCLNCMWCGYIKDGVPRCLKKYDVNDSFRTGDCYYFLSPSDNYSNITTYPNISMYPRYIHDADILLLATTSTSNDYVYTDISDDIIAYNFYSQDNIIEDGLCGGVIIKNASKYHVRVDVIRSHNMAMLSVFIYTMADNTRVGAFRITNTFTSNTITYDCVTSDFLFYFECYIKEVANMQNFKFTDKLTTLNTLKEYANKVGRDSIE